MAKLLAATSTAALFCRAAEPPLVPHERGVVEWFFAWLHNSRRLVTRSQRHVENFVATLQLGCVRILLNRL